MSRESVSSRNSRRPWRPLNVTYILCHPQASTLRRESMILYMGHSKWRPLTRFMLPEFSLVLRIHQTSLLKRSVVAMGVKGPRKRQWSHTNVKYSPNRSSHKYEYLPLDSSKNEIRLLKLLYASSSDEPIQCVIFHTSLDDAPPYQALSYSMCNSYIKNTFFYRSREAGTCFGSLQASKRHNNELSSQTPCSLTPPCKLTFYYTNLY